MREKCYIAIDLKSFYASVECVECGLDPLTTNLVVADKSRTEKTICLAVSPALKEYGIPGRARLFEVNEKVREINSKRLDNFRKAAKNNENPKSKNEGFSVEIANNSHVKNVDFDSKNSGESYNKNVDFGVKFAGESCDKNELLKHPEYKLGFIIARPQMAKYLEISQKIYRIYLNFVAAEDVHVYSVDEVFIDATSYLDSYKMSGEELATKMIHEVLRATGITATAGIGTNLYLAKIAMDIVAKHTEADENGVRIASLDEKSYRKILWNHRPITDFWRVGRGYARRLSRYGMYTMGDVAKCSIGKESDFYNEELLYKIFGINAEFLIDHAWGYEPCTIQNIKSYRSENHSLSNGQVLTRPYRFLEAKTIVREMANELAYDLVLKGLTTDQIVLTVIYDVANKVTNLEENEADFFGRKRPKHAHGSLNIGRTNSAKKIANAAVSIFENKANERFLVRKIYVVAAHIKDENMIEENKPEQLNMFVDYKKKDAEKVREKHNDLRERDLTKAVIKIKKRYGKNSMLFGTDFEDGATGRMRNEQIGGHRK